MIGILPAAAAAAGLTLLAVRLRAGSVVLATAGDEDMKIAPGSFSAAKGESDLSEAEAAAQAYLRQKGAGNVDKARELGEKFAGLLDTRSKEYLEPPEHPQARLRAHHKILLFSYVVNRVIADLSPNSILAQTALNVFYDTLEYGSPELSEHIRDMAAFSLYILCERSETCIEDEIGKVYAQLCGAGDVAPIIDEGNLLYREYYAECSRLHEQTKYSDA